MNCILYSHQNEEFKHSADDIVLHLAEGKAAATGIQLKNLLKSYACNLRSSLTNKKTADMFD